MIWRSRFSWALKLLILLNSLNCIELLTAVILEIFLNILKIHQFYVNFRHMYLIIFTQGVCLVRTF